MIFFIFVIKRFLVFRKVELLIVLLISLGKGDDYQISCWFHWKRELSEFNMITCAILFHGELSTYICLSHVVVGIMYSIYVHRRTSKFMVMWSNQLFNKSHLLRNICTCLYSILGFGLIKSCHVVIIVYNVNS